MADQAMLLVADDDEAVRLSLERALTREGYGVVLAPDGQAAHGRVDVRAHRDGACGGSGREMSDGVHESSHDHDSTFHWRHKDWH